MGHGDDKVLADGNFPVARNSGRLVRCYGHGVPVLLEAIFTLFPLDTFVKQPVSKWSSGLRSPSGRKKRK